jgi:hypothetical protein
LVSDAEAPFARREGHLIVVTPDRRQIGAERYTSRDAPRLDISELAIRLGLESVVA